MPLRIALPEELIEDILFCCKRVIPLTSFYFSNNINMGNASSTTQKIHNIISTNATVDAIASERVNCTQDVVVNWEYGKNCPLSFNQECYAMANASLDTVISALQNAELDKESKQAIDGLALGLNVDVANQDIRQEVLNTLHAKCKAEAESNVVQRKEFNLGIMDCTDMDEPLIELYNYGDAGADCVVKTIVDNAQKSKSSAEADQLLEGLKLPDSRESLMMILGAAIILALVRMSGGGGGNGLEASQQLAGQAIKAKLSKQKQG